MASSSSSSSSSSCIQLRYCTHGFSDSGTCSSILLPRSSSSSSSSINYETLNKHFPYKGSFHYRIKSIEGNSFMWRDVIKGEAIKISDSTSVLDVQVLILANHNDDHDEEDDGWCGDYYEDISRELRSVDRRKQRDVNETAPAINLANLANLAKGATSVWSSLVSSINSSLANSSAPLTDEAEQQLADLADKLSSRYDESIPQHAHLMEDIWRKLLVNESSDAVAFERVSVRWKEAGFQSSDPSSDLKQSGILALYSMDYMSSIYASKTLRMLTAQRSNTSSHYPFAVVAVNLTMLLASIIGLKNHKYLSMQTNYWPFFEASNSYYEVFCACFFHLDYIWTHRKSTRADFSRIIDEVRVLISAVLQRAPRSVDEFRYIAQEESMVISS